MGETYSQLLADRSTCEDYDLENAPHSTLKTTGFARIQRPAIEHLVGVRWAVTTAALAWTVRSLPASTRQPSPERSSSVR
jgi:hypothetical protein